MELTKEEVKARILRKLIRWRKWGGSHTENVLNGLPRHLRGEKIVKEALEELVQLQWLLPAMKTGEVHYSLNPRKVKEIMQFYKSYSEE